MSVQTYDVIIVGAGIAGLALANKLALDGLKLAVVEAGDRPNPTPAQEDEAVPAGATPINLNAWDRRVSALTPTSEELLKSVGAWPLMTEKRVAPYSGMRVWDADGTGQIAFCATDMGIPLLGHIVENRVTTEALVVCAEQQRKVDLYWGDPLATVDTQPSGGRNAEAPASGTKADQRPGASVTVKLQSGTQLSTELLVGADGARSRVRELLGFNTRAWSYEQRAIVATVALANSHNQVCYQAFMSTGPLALLPLAEPRLCSIVWSLDNSVVEQRLGADDDEFLRHLNLALTGSGQEVVGVGDRACFPLHQCHAVDYTQPRVALIADAAHSIHPLAGQGINLGLKDVEVLAREVLHAWAQGLDHGDPAVLRRYQRQRKGDNLSMMAAMEAFKRGFGSQQPLLRVARNLGLNWVDSLTPLKHWLAAQALR